MITKIPSEFERTAGLSLVKLWLDKSGSSGLGASDEGEFVSDVLLPF